MRPRPLPRHWPRPGLALRRRPRARRALAVAAALVVGLAVHASQSSADRARAAWGEQVSVLVATQDLQPGDTLDGATEVVDWPAALAPEHRVAAVDPGARVTTAVYEGEAIDDRRLAPAGVTALAARIPDGLRAVAIPVEPGTAPALEVGDQVDVLVALAGDDAGGGPPGFTLVPAALVVAIGEDAVTIAVDPDQAPRIAVALASGAVSLAAVGAA